MLVKAGRGRATEQPTSLWRVWGWRPCSGGVEADQVDAEKTRVDVCEHSSYYLESSEHAGI
ncbi:hypothetical protein ACOMHN_059912 [Nucella lapillus]